MQFNSNNKETQDNNTNNTNNTNALSVDFQTRNQRGIQFNQRPTTSVSTKLGYNTSHNESDNAIQEQPWTIDDIMQRFKFVGSYPVPTTATSHEVIAKLRVPHDLIDSNSATQAPFDNFIFWNGDIHIHSQMTASPTVQGCVALVFVPLTSQQTIESTIIPNFSALTVNQVNYLFPNTNTSADMIIKYNSPYSNLNIRDTSLVSQENTLGYLYYVVINPIQLSTSSSDNIAISTFTHFENNKFKVPRMAGITTRYKAKARGQSLPTGTPQPSSKGLVSGIVDKILPDNVIGDVIDVAAGIFGLDNPTISSLQEPTKVVSTQPMNFHVGAEYIDKLTINPSATTPITQDTFATTCDEMNHEYLYSKFSYLGSFAVTTADPLGKVVASFPMNPCPNRIENGTTTQVPLLQYISSLYEFWNGSLTYRFQIISTMMQTCKLMIGLNYGEYEPEASGLMERVASQYGQIIEINQGSNTIDITVDYIAGTPSLHVPCSNTPSKFDTMGMVNVAILNPLVATTGAPDNITINTYIAGSKTFNLNTLSASKNLQPYFPVKLSSIIKKKKKIYIKEESESEDIEVIDMDPPKPLRRFNIRGQSASQPVITPQSEIDTIDEENLVSKSESTAPRMPVAQVYVPGTRELLKKYQMYGTLNLPPVTLQNESNVVRIRLNSLFGRSAISALTSPTAEYAPPLGIFTHIQGMYRLFKGGLNFKIMPRVYSNALGAANFSVVYQPPVYTTTPTQVDLTETIKNQMYMSFENATNKNARQELQLPYCTRLPIHYVNGINKTAEFTVPFSSRFLSVVSTLGDNSENELRTAEIADLGDIYIIYNFDSRSSVDDREAMDIFFSFSDDARFGTLFNVPQLTTYSYVDATGIVTSSPQPDNYGTGAPVANTLVVL
uniref:Polyprotein n=1 Tax=Ulva picorna-like virus 4 TaxID=3051532 RepID=A0A9Y1YTA3_9VIRU|nr:MAG: polyprotein [Ulva picorna-like virus 4]